MLKKVLKWIGIIAGSLVGLFVLAIVVLFFIGGAKVDKKYDVPVESISIPSDPAAIQRGEHLATILICKRCHTDNLSGQLYYDVPGLLSIPTPNLTSGAGGIGSYYTDADWVRAIRHGVGSDGRPLFFMLSTEFRHLGEKDTAALIAYLKSVPPVDNVLPARHIDPLARVMIGAGQLPPLPAETIDHTTAFPNAPEPGVTAAYGELLTRTCTECHGANLNGAPFGPPGQEVATPNLTPGGELLGWSEQAFITTIRTGVTPGGHQLNDEMPWKYFGQMTDDELKAVWLYLQSLPALQQGG